MKLSIVIISSRESSVILSHTIETLLTACKEYDFSIHLLLNGNEINARDISESFLIKYPTNLRIWFFPLGDKANCFNQYCYKIAGDYDFHFFVDGYVTINSDSVTNTIVKAEKHEALAYTGTPATGYSSRKLSEEMLTKGGLHGNFFMLPKYCIQKLKASCFKLPIGIYRTDSVIASAINYRFAPNENNRDPANICVLPNVTWQHPILKWYNPKDLLTHAKRYLRQSEGKIENLAVKTIFTLNKEPVSKLNEYSHDLCLEYLNKNPLSISFLIRNPGLFGLRSKLIQKKANEDILSEQKNKLWELTLP
ncbi:hypothetical protein [Alishewanella tabrizica]|uniref:Glycosyltransferase n=1 Tax=Alishewanella tabrizica TaxID=671278 RepID=A0ABQ2WLH4_9ALTE|nr:hypothetical protein [Alishewanella tabrizica]GGW62626.1 hypothetical protein GCM10008111_18240 [Alishewanella tabrizica]